MLIQASFEYFSTQKFFVWKIRSKEQYRADRILDVTLKVAVACSLSTAFTSRQAICIRILTPMQSLA